MPGSMPTKLAQQTIRSINKIALLAYDRPSVQHNSLDVGTWQRSSWNETKVNIESNLPAQI